MVLQLPRRPCPEWPGRKGCRPAAQCPGDHRLAGAGRPGYARAPDARLRCLGKAHVSRRHQSRGPAWHARPAPRILFQHQLAACGLPISTVRPPRRHRGGFALSVRLRVPDIPEQTITTVFGPRAAAVPHVYTEEPTRSPHRYSDNLSPNGMDAGTVCDWRESAVTHRWVCDPNALLRPGTTAMIWSAGASQPRGEKSMKIRSDQRSGDLDA